MPKSNKKKRYYIFEYYLTKSFLCCHKVVSLHGIEELLISLVFCIMSNVRLRESLFHSINVFRCNKNICSLALRTTKRLMNHDLSIRKSITTAWRTGGQQK